MTQAPIPKPAPRALVDCFAELDSAQDVTFAALQAEKLIGDSEMGAFADLLDATIAPLVEASRLDRWRALVAKGDGAVAEAMEFAFLDNYLIEAVAAHLAGVDLSKAPLWAATYNKKAYKGFEEEIALVRYLIARGASVDSAPGATGPLHHFAYYHFFGGPHPRAIKLLLERGANPNLADESGDTPLVCLSGFTDWNPRMSSAMLRLLAAGADPSIVSTRDGTTPAKLLGTQLNEALGGNNARKTMIALLDSVAAGRPIELLELLEQEAAAVETPEHFLHLVGYGPHIEAGHWGAFAAILDGAARRIGGGAYLRDAFGGRDDHEAMWADALAKGQPAQVVALGALGLGDLDGSLARFVHGRFSGGKFPAHPEDLTTLHYLLAKGADAADLLLFKDGAGGVDEVDALGLLCETNGTALGQNPAIVEALLAAWASPDGDGGLWTPLQRLARLDDWSDEAGINFRRLLAAGADFFASGIADYEQLKAAQADWPHPDRAALIEELASPSVQARVKALAKR